MKIFGASLAVYLDTACLKKIIMHFSRNLSATWHIYQGFSYGYNWVLKMQKDLHSKNCFIKLKQEIKIVQMFRLSAFVSVTIVLNDYIKTLQILR